MRKILTADQFFTSILAALKLSDVKVLQDVSLDQRFERAYETLLLRENELGITPNFTFFRDPLHGNAVKLRNALLAARENGLLSPDAGKSLVYRLDMDEKRAKSYLSHSPLTETFLRDLVKQHFQAEFPATAR